MRKNSNGCQPHSCGDAPALGSLNPLSLDNGGDSGSGYFVHRCNSQVHSASAPESGLHRLGPDSLLLALMLTSPVPSFYFVQLALVYHWCVMVSRQMRPNFGHETIFGHITYQCFYQLAAFEQQ